jgi:hypothetical protein|tara:strand:+ start:3282 stop:3449 length:168 start_codon:yes stop_codon:yes gene_type:complete
MTIKKLIQEYVDDHLSNFDCYPIDVEVENKIYSWDEYWDILYEEENNEEKDQETS